MALYKNYIILLVSVLALASNVFAARLQFLAKYSEGGLQGHGGTEKKAAGECDSKNDDSLISKASEWSGGAFHARRARLPNMIYVESVHTYQTQGQASSAIQHAIPSIKRHLN